MKMKIGPVRAPGEPSKHPSSERLSRACERPIARVVSAHLLPALRTSILMVMFCPATSCFSATDCAMGVRPGGVGQRIRRRIGHGPINRLI